MLRTGGSRLVAPGLRRLLGERAQQGLAPAGARAYHERVVDHCSIPRNVGSFDKDDLNVGTGLVGAPACGDVMKLQIPVDEGTGKIVDACFKTFGCGSAIASSSVGRYTNLLRTHTFTSRGIPSNFHQLIPNVGISTTRNLLAEDNAMVPVSSPLTSPLGSAEETDKKGAVVNKLKVQAIKKDIKQSPRKVNLVAKLVRGMRVEDALLQLQVTVKRAAKTLYQVIHSARANAAHNHGLDPDKLLVEEAFVGKGLYLKRLSYHAKGRCGMMERPRCRLTVVVREATAEEEAKIAKLRVSNYKKLTRKEKQLMPHRLIEVSPKWARKQKAEADASS